MFVGGLWVKSTLFWLLFSLLLLPPVSLATAAFLSPPPSLPPISPLSPSFLPSSPSSSYTPLLLSPSLQPMPAIFSSSTIITATANVSIIPIIFFILTSNLTSYLHPHLHPFILISHLTSNLISTSLSSSLPPPSPSLSSPPLPPS